jgi:hypothetical protein
MKIGGRELFRGEAFKFRMAIANAAEQEWLSGQGIGVPPPRPALALFCEFIEAKHQEILAKRDWRLILEVTCEMRSLLNTLIDCGHIQLKDTLAQIDADIDRFVKAARLSLMKDFLDAPSEERAEEIKLTIIDLVEGGYYHGWREDMDDILWSRAMGEIEALRRERVPIQPWAC